MSSRNMYGLKRNGRIDWQHSGNKRCVYLLHWGFSVSCIQKETGLTPSKIMYRAKAKNIRIRDYRNGSGPKAIVLLSKFKIKKQGA